MARDPAGRSTFPIELRPRLLYNPDLLSERFFVPGLVGIILQLVTVFLTSFAIVREREIGTLEQLFVTPVGRLGLMLGKLLPYLIIGTVVMVTVLLVMVFLFHVPIRGNLFLLLGLGMLFLFSALGLGVLISTVAANQVQAMQMAMLVMLPFDSAVRLRLPARQHAAAAVLAGIPVPGDVLHRDPPRRDPARRRLLRSAALDRRPGRLQLRPADTQRLAIPEVVGLDWMSMAISIQCPACSKPLKAPAEMAGKRARCPNCRQPVAIPRPTDSQETRKLEADFGLAPSPPDVKSSSPEPAPLDTLGLLQPEDNWSTADLATPLLTAPLPPRPASYIAPAVRPTAGWRYWLFALTLVPLALSLLMPETSQVDWQDPGDESSVSEEPAAESGEPTEDPPVVDDERMRQIGDLDLDDLVRMFPDNRLPGAHLARDTWMHWLYALLAAGLFFGLILLLFQQGQATPVQLLGVGLLTATCGVVSLIMFQWFATAGSVLRFVGIFGIFTLVIRLIGFSYAAALDPRATAS